jgi:uncharacterized protein (TIGR02246 family)
MFKFVTAFVCLLCLGVENQSSSPSMYLMQVASQSGKEISSKLQKATGPEGQIRQVLISQVDAWNRGDLEGYMNGYWRSSDLTFFSGGAVTKGWDPTLQRYRQRYQGQGKEMGKLEFQDLDIQLLGPRAAVIRGKWQLTMSDGKQPHGLFTLIMKKMQPGWRIVHDHTSVAE